MVSGAREFSSSTRKEALRDADGQVFDVAVVGAGINGSATANLLATSGIRTVLLDRRDFAYGTSSRSSKMIHGGLRYLQQGRVMEVRRLLRERDYWLSSSGDVVRMRFDLLLTEHGWNRHMLAFGLFLYSLLDGRFEVPRVKDNTGEYPEAVRGYFTYWDAVTHDARLVIGHVCSAWQMGATCLNYVDILSISGSGPYTVRIRDSLDGQVAEFTCTCLVNASGPWAGDVARMAGVGLPVSLTLSRGMHLVLTCPGGTLRNAVAFRSAIDGRQLFMVPRGNTVILGTTEVKVESPDDLECSREEEMYLMDSASAVFPWVRQCGVVARYTGIRPLIGSHSDPGRASRDSSIVVTGNVVHVLGGKLTDHRVTARRAARAVSGITGKRVSGSGPDIVYRRPAVADPVDWDRRYECAIFPEDIYVRREGWFFYDPTVHRELAGGDAAGGGGTCYS
ncbi:hypothetical protein GCM10007108_12720 [Thermogymnomonas acidicola]|uniref:FAD dependent oxidoreductase domain-containing protein n=1 Tax=Thermogymnomonas acidicola TaxID=399579 RepID=A0AA37FBF7_9ARCH|nr:FAD-dependent oxidoreductase [Thermogymnomonas acidicola]GGM76188.1 hypothetical protein GCM10007108_12720 [Thermogymnomonas acidicola]